ncbi:MAG: conserved Crenarchaeal protein [Candidatus Gottesmanbacteria bacterium GW2011_GWA2_43_14]|uniref:Conserved Crenarchaeal protein n=1 Tax=Candidatus Gottesmanbacteria bacterium GW2011_GWA2_43_14 TaxID=1618443 RepID=A0A0G1DLJ6_9BACT|nr:MAG: conserved Crenarchaeal protein [Candidatus Gottesmanbacteria bacterium GW2011_GWA2_43_14]
MFTKSDKNWLKKNFATKDDLKNFATKDDLKDYATKKDLIGLATSKDIEELKTTFLINLEKWKNELFNKIDPVLNRVKTAEEENVVLHSREEGRQEERNALEGRIKNLEAIHPNNRHIQSTKD